MNIDADIENKSLIFSDGEVCEKLKLARNPDLYHQVACAVKCDCDSYPLLQWIVEQPDCDKATALTVLGITAAYEHIFRMSYETESGAVSEIARTICENSEQGFYKRSEIGLQDVETAWQPAQLKGQVEEGCHKLDGSAGGPYLPVPKQLLDHVYPDVPAIYTGYFGDEVGLWDIKTNVPEPMWPMFGVPAVDR